MKVSPRGCCPIVIKLFILLFLTGSSAFSQTNRSRVLILGNLGDVPAGSPFFPALRSTIEAPDRPVHIILAGDMVPNCIDGEPVTGHLQDFFRAVEGLDHVEVTALPGDRDWDTSGPRGYKCAETLEKFMEKKGPDNVRWPVDDACPGPEVKEIAPDITLITLNTQWWNHPFRKPTPADGICDAVIPYVILEEFRDAIEENLDKYVLIAGHFPPVSLGKYGGNYPLSEHLWPPLIGSMKIAYHQGIGGPKDLNNERFDFFADELKSIAAEFEGLAFISGHEANQQILNYRGNYLINSGAPLRGDFALQTRQATLSSNAPGFIEIAYEENGEVYYIFHRWEGNHLQPGAPRPLYQSPCTAVIDTSLFFSPNQRCGELYTPTELIHKLEYPTVKAVAGLPYRAGFLKKIFFGRHYRDTWTTPVEVPFLPMDTLLGGLSPTKRGGGRQTISLKLRGADKTEYVFRSVDKDPAAALSFRLRESIVYKVTQDQTSAQHPYGALVISSLLDQLDILHARPKLYLMPPDPHLGGFLSPFSNMLGLLEERPARVKAGRPAFADADEIYKSYELFQEKFNDPEVRVNTEELAQARMFDILVGDWSKHEDNWKWAAYEYEDSTLVRPIPRDRDNVFYRSEGILPWIADREWAIPNIENFGYKIGNIRSLTWQARHLDRYLLSELNQADWLAAAEYIQRQLPDEAIRSSVRELPPEVYPLSGTVIESKLIQRKKDLKSYAKKFYALLARQVDVVGTNEQERFEVTRQADGSTLVEMFEKKSGRKLFSRRFLPEETKEIRLYGLHGSDDFNISGEARRAIKLRVIGGPGTDSVDDGSAIKRGNQHTLIYEKSEKATIRTGTEAKRIHHWNDNLYYYNRTAFQYNTSAPLISVGFNSFNGITFGGGVAFTQRSFTKRDFSVKHHFFASVSTLGNYVLDYKGVWHEAIEKWDVSFQTGFGRPSIYNFFYGLGNETVNDESLLGADYYRFFLDAFQTKIGLKRDFLRKSNFSLDVGYERYRSADTEGTILEDQPDIFGNGILRMLTATANLEFDLRDHEVFPRKGFVLWASQELGRVSEESFGLTDLAAAVFLTPTKLPVTIGFKVGWGASAGSVPFYKQPSLGLGEGLRGFQRNRFTGDERLYWNSELRIPLGSFDTPIIPIGIGIQAFYDRGQIRQKGEANSSVWHSAYGGGFYLIPVSRSYSISVLAGFSKEESGIISFQLGTNF